MRRRIRTTALLASIILFGIAQYACIDDVDSINLPESNPKLVVQSFICPGDSIKVTVQSSKPYNYNLTQQGNEWEFDWVMDAVVTLQNITTSESHIIPFMSTLNTYAIAASEFSIEAGHQYELNVSAPGFSPVRAVTTVPSGTPTVSNLTAENMGSNEWGEYTILITGSINDIAGQNDYYSVSTSQFTTYTWDEESYTNLNNYLRILLTDTDKDGDTISFRVDVSGYSEDESVHSEARVMILSTDEHYYKFHKSLTTIYDVTDNPFAESTHLYSNIEGGLGVFASFVSVYSETFTGNQGL